MSKNKEFLLENPSGGLSGMEKFLAERILQEEGINYRVLQSGETTCDTFLEDRLNIVLRNDHVVVDAFWG